MKNADVIRSMTDEQLYEFLSEWEQQDIDYAITFCDLCEQGKREGGNGNELGLDCDGCREHFLKVDAESYLGLNGWLRHNGFEPSIEPQQWIPCSERLPKAEDMYQPPEQRYLCQLEAYGERKFCVLSRLKGAVSPFWDWYGVAVHDSEVTAWMPLPKPYKGGEDECV